MKSLECTIRFEDEHAMHPVHRRLVADDAIVRDELLHGHSAGKGPDTLLFYVEGDGETYVEALEATDSIVDYELTRLGENAWYAYLREETRSFDAALRGAFEGPGLLAVPPVEFRSDGTARLTVVGESDALADALEDLPAAVSVDVDRIGEYDAPPTSARGGLTDRQYEAVSAAFAVGYYDVPRSGSLSEVAEALDCAPGTASEHLRKAERELVSEALERRDG